MKTVRHPHKGSLTKRHLLNEVPIVEMSDQERQFSFDEMSRDLHIRMLEEARKSEAFFLIAAAILRRPGQRDGVPYYVPEYGDGEGEESIEDFIDSVRRANLLKPNETLHLELFRFDLPKERNAA